MGQPGAGVSHSPRRPEWELWLGTAARVVLAGVMGVAALTKIGTPEATVRAVRAYRIFPEGLAVPFAHALPAVELVVAALLLLGVAVRLTAAVTAGLLATFVVGIASAAARGLKIDCGCFGGGGPTQHPHYAVELLRDTLLLAIASGLTVLGRSRWQLDPVALDQPVLEVAEGASRGAQRRQRTAMARAAQARARVANRRRALTGLAVALLVLAGGIGVIAGRASVPHGRIDTPAGVTSHGGILVGSPAAPRHLVVFEDPQCPICGEFERTSGAVLRQAVSAGTVQVEYRMRSFLGPESVRAVSALGAAQQEGKFEALREAMYAHQPKEQTGGYSVGDLLQLGSAVGLTDQAYTQAVRQGAFTAWARRVDDQASRDGNVATPELRLDGVTLTEQLIFRPALLARALGLPSSGS